MTPYDNMIISPSFDDFKFNTLKKSLTCVILYYLVSLTNYELVILIIIF